MEEERFLVGLTEGLGLASWRLPALFEHYQSFQAIWNLPENELSRWGIKDKDLYSLRAYKQTDQLNTNIERLGTRSIACVPFWSSLYPKSLINCQSRPLLLFVQGDVGTLNTPSITIVGSRQLRSDKTRQLAEWFPKLASYKPTIISGLARGVDGLAHKLALANKLPTVAVVAHGLDCVYPSEHQPLRIQILKQGGAIVSELPLGIRPQKYLFLARNRIMVGMSQIVIVVQAEVNSGTTASATLAAEEGREVWAIPGTVGTDLLIDEGANKLTAIEDLLDNLR